MIKPEDQLTDGGAVIGYKPNLEYKKEINGKSELHQNQNKEDENYYDEEGNLILADKNNPRKYVLGDDAIDEYKLLRPFTKTLRGFIKNPPGKTIDNLISTSDFISDVIDRLSDAFNNEDEILNNKYDKFSNIEGLINGIKTDDKEYVKDFIDKYKDDINASQIPEMIQHLQKLKDNLDKATGYVKNLYYGDYNIEPSAYRKSDEDLINIMKAQEKKAKDKTSDVDFTNINYMTVGSDSLLNTGISIYCSKLKDKVALFEQVAYLKDDTGIKNSIMIPMVQRMFDEINEELEARQITYDAQYNVDTKEKALYNYYKARSDLKDLYNAISESTTETNFLLKHVQDYEDMLTDAIDNVNRAFLYDIHNTEELTRLYKEKQYMRSMNKNLNVMQ